MSSQSKITIKGGNTVNSLKISKYLLDKVEVAVRKLVENNLEKEEVEGGSFLVSVNEDEDNLTKIAILTIDGKEIFLHQRI